MLSAKGCNDCLKGRAVKNPRTVTAPPLGPPATGWHHQQLGGTTALLSSKRQLCKTTTLGNECLRQSIAHSRSSGDVHESKERSMLDSGEGHLNFILGLECSRGHSMHVTLGHNVVTSISWIWSQGQVTPSEGHHTNVKLLLC